MFRNVFMVSVGLFALHGKLSVAETNTPFAAGEQVIVATDKQTVFGKVEDSIDPHWIRIVEDKTGRLVAVRLEVVQTVSKVTPAGPSKPERPDRERLEPEEFDPAREPKFKPRVPKGGPPSAARDFGQPQNWVLRSKHFLHGMPRLVDGRHNFIPAGTTLQPGVSVLVREGFVVGHYDKFKVPLWVSMKWTRENLQDSQGAGLPRPFKPDDELPGYAQAGTNYEFATSRMQRGHFARHQDNAAFGRDNSDAGCLMSNIAPQHEGLNPISWLALENEHRNVVSGEEFDIQDVWVISGSIFPGGQPRDLIGNDVGIPDACFKVIAWEDSDGRLQARGYVLTQDDHDPTPEQYLRKIDDIEQVTGLDFFPELEESVEAPLEGHDPVSMWQSEQ